MPSCSGTAGLVTAVSFQQTRDHNLILGLELLVDHAGQAFQNSVDLFLLQSALIGNCLDKFSLAHTFCFYAMASSFG